MKIERFIKMKNGNVKVITNKCNYEIAKDADWGNPYGIGLPEDDFFSSIFKGKGKKIYSLIVKEIEKNNHIPIINE